MTNNTAVISTNKIIFKVFQSAYTASHSGEFAAGQKGRTSLFPCGF
jgi:hypothetical protein